LLVVPWRNILFRHSVDLWMQSVSTFLRFLIHPHDWLTYSMNEPHSQQILGIAFASTQVFILFLVSISRITIARGMKKRLQQRHFCESCVTTLWQKGEPTTLLHTRHAMPQATLLLLFISSSSLTGLQLIFNGWNSNATRQNPKIVLVFPLAKNVRISMLLLLLKSFSNCSSYENNVENNLDVRPSTCKSLWCPRSISFKYFVDAVLTYERMCIRIVEISLAHHRMPTCILSPYTLHSSKYLTLILDYDDLMVINYYEHRAV